MQDLSAGVVGRFFVPGRSRTKGSLKPIHVKAGPGRCRVSLTEDHGLSEPWKKRMISAIWEQTPQKPVRAGRKITGYELLPYPDAVEVHAFFRFQREQAVGGGVWPSHATRWPTSDDIGDEDKLRRNLLDALTQSGLIADDALVVGGANYKRWCSEDEQPGVLVVVRTVDLQSLAELLALEDAAAEL